MKQIVTKSCRYEPTFTDMMQQWALHNNIILLAARVRKPKDKASVENEVKLTYQRIYAPLRDTVFFSPEELNKSIREQLAGHHRLLLQKKSYSRHDCFINHEKPLLQPLPFSSFVIKHSAEANILNFFGWGNFGPSIQTKKDESCMLLFHWRKVFAAKQRKKVKFFGTTI